MAKRLVDLVFVFQFGGIGPTCWWHNTVLTQINNHLAVVIRHVPDAHNAQAQAGIRPGPLNRFIHAFFGNCPQGLFQGSEGIAQVVEEFDTRFCGIGTTLVTVLRWIRAIQEGGKRKVGTCHMFHLFCKGALLGGPELRFLVLEQSCRGSVIPFLLGHGFGGGPELKLLVIEEARECFARNSFLLNSAAEGGFCMVRMGSTSGPQVYSVRISIAISPSLLRSW